MNQDRLAILYYVSALINTYIDLYWSGENEDGSGKETGEGNEEDHVELLTLAQVYNESLEALWMAPSEATIVTAQPSPEVKNNPALQSRWTETVSRVKVVVQLDGANNNDSPLLKFSLKALPAVRLLEQLASKKALHLSRLIATNFHSLSFSHKEPNTTNVPVNTETKKMCTNLEDHAAGIYLDGFFASAAKIPGLLPRSKGKKNAERETDKGALSVNARKKLVAIFQHYLWSSVGDITLDNILWSHDHQRVPFVLRPTVTIGDMKVNPLKSWKPTRLKPEDADEDWARCLHAMETVFAGLQSYMQLSTWDEKMIGGIGCARKIKRPEQVTIQRSPSTGQYSSDIGRKFGDISANCLTIIGGSSEIDELGPLETSLCDEAGILFRLDATLGYFNSWMVRRAKVWLNGWAIPQFVACSQRDTALIANSVREKKVKTGRYIFLTIILRNS